MRNILFRGKDRVTGEWIKGFPFESLQDGWYLNHGSNNAPSPVQSHTIGQCTGLTDKNGKLIFEGDIIKTQPLYDKPYAKNKKSKQFYGFVTWEEYTISGDPLGLIKQVYDAKFVVNLPDTGRYIHCSFNLFYGCEVVGNIYDNPELIQDVRVQW